MNSPNKGQRRWALMLSLICAWITGGVNNREAGDLRRQCTHYNVIVMLFCRNTTREGLSVAWWIGYVMPCQMASHCVIFILISIFVMILYLYIGIIVLYAHTSARTLWTCRGWPVPGQCWSRRTNSGPLVIRCDTINGIWNQMMKCYSGVTSSWWWCLC